MRNWKSWCVPAVIAGLHGAALAQVSVPVGPGAVFDVLRADPDHWYLDYTRTTGAAQADDQLSNDFHESFGALAAQSLVQARSGGKAASAHVAVQSDALRASANALNSELASTLSQSLGSGNLSFVAFMNSPGPITLDLHLTGHLLVNGQRSPLDAQPSQAGVAVAALGSLSNGISADYAALYQAAGIDPNAEGNALLAQLLTWPNSAQRNLQTIGALAVDAPTRTDIPIDQRFSVTADGSPVECPPGVNLPVCNTNFFFFSILLFAGAQNGGIADFENTLKVEAIHLPAGATLAFEPGQAIPVVTAAVPEPATAGSLLAGLGLLAALRRRRS